MRGRGNGSLIKMCCSWSTYVKRRIVLSCENYHLLCWIRQQIKVYFFVINSMFFPLYWQRRKRRRRKKRKRRRRSSLFYLSYLTVCPLLSIMGIASKLHGALSVFDKIPHDDDGKYFGDMASSAQTLGQRQPMCAI